MRAPTAAVLIAISALFTVAEPSRASRARLPAVADSTIVVLLGTGTPSPDPAASGPATAVVVGSRVFLFDAGPGVERRLQAAMLPINGVTGLFITHLHSDHTLGYPDLIFTSWVMGRKAPLQAYGPHGLRNMTDHIIAAWSEDIEIRTNGFEHQPRDGYRVTVHEIAPGVVYDSAGVKITAIPVLHGDWKEAYGYRIDTPTRSIVISGDTRPSDALVNAARGIDVLIHEVYPEAKLAPDNRPGGEDWPKYMRSFHTSDVELGRVAASAAPRLLILYHVANRRGSTDANMLAAVQKGGFTGRAVVGKDLERY
jgi:ribonuclease BN (tRNA processing enzyme)